MKIFGITGWKNTGKTTLTERLVSEITRRGISVSTLKHAHHGFDMDHPGKDSFRHRAAGAREVLVASGRRWALIHELREAPEPALPELLKRLSPVDLVLIEGWKQGGHPRLETTRAGCAGNGRPLRALEDAGILAVASDAPIPYALSQPVLDLDDIPAIADFILAQTGLVP